MRKQKRKQLARLLAAKKTENAKIDEVINLQKQVRDIAVHVKHIDNRSLSQDETIRLFYRFFLREQSRLEGMIIKDRLGDILLGTGSIIMAIVIFFIIWKW